MNNLISKTLKKPIMRYLVLAGCLVVVEVLSFAFLNSALGLSYLIATPISMIIVIFLNWYLGRLFVFTDKRYRARTEFALVLTASLVGLCIQLAVTAFFVEIVNIMPIIGKCLAIGVTFFWNYWIRKNYIFKSR